MSGSPVAYRAPAYESAAELRFRSADWLQAQQILCEDVAVVNRTQAVVLGFFIVVWIALVGILMAAPTVYDQALLLLPGGRSAEFAFLAGISALIALLATGVLRRWRWTFWLIVVAFILGFLRVPASILQLARILPPAGPSWYVLFQGLVGLVQCAIGVAMLVAYRRAGPWGAF